MVAPGVVSEIVTVCAELYVPGGIENVGVAAAVGVVVVPVPERASVWGLPAALSVRVSEADRSPLAVGVKVTLIVQLCPTPTELPQLLVWAKSLAFVPVIATLVICSIPWARSLTEMVCATLVVPTERLAKESSLG